MVGNLRILSATRDRWVPWLILAGGLLAGVGWVVGVAWLWSSRTWTRREKIVATLLVPGGIALSLPLLIVSVTTRTSDCTNIGGPGQPTVTHCAAKWLAVSGPGAPVLVALVAIPVAVAVHLEKVRRLRQPSNMRGAPLMVTPPDL